MKLIKYVCTFVLVLLLISGCKDNKIDDNTILEDDISSIPSIEDNTQIIVEENDHTFEVILPNYSNNYTWNDIMFDEDGVQLVLVYSVVDGDYTRFVYKSISAGSGAIMFTYETDIDSDDYNSISILEYLYKVNDNLEIELVLKNGTVNDIAAPEPTIK